MTTAMQTLQVIREFAGNRATIGLDDATIERFLTVDPTLGEAIDAALAAHEALQGEFGDLLAGEELALAASLQSDLVNFYPPDSVNPYVPIAARGPWVVTSHGAVMHDNGGYGMLGMGHAPKAVLEAMNAPHIMANVMTPSVSHKRFTDRLMAEVGQKRGSCPYPRFICVNSGSESVSVACRISDVNALRMTRSGGRHEGREAKLMSLKGSFHGRTDRPAQASDSTRPKYRANLNSHHDRTNLITVHPNDVDGLRAAFAQADADGVFIEMLLIEPVMGEGNPGQAITREFYDAARELTTAHGSLLLVDSIQAGLRGTGYLSIVDYPGFEDCEAPDLETYSKALNAGQYPMSVLACSERAAGLYVHGVYGNTMTTNPRALEVACAVLDGVTDELRENIRVRGAELVAGLASLRDEFGDVVRYAQGTGLLVSAELDPSIAVTGFDGIEAWLRRNGLGVIHGGENSLRFTPHFAMTADEVQLIVELVRRGLRAFVDVDALKVEMPERVQRA